MRSQDISGQKFNRLTAVERSYQRKASRAWVWRCKCDCGKEAFVDIGHLRSGTTKSCGCQRGKETKHGLHNSPTYLSWKSMKARCDNQNSPDYHLYGGRGVSYAPEFETFDGFVAAMGERPKGRTLDRKDPGGDYTPENCRWATNAEQARNKRNTTLLTFRGETKSVPDWADATGIKAPTIHMRIKRGWSVEKALTVRRENGTSKVIE